MFVLAFAVAAFAKDNSADVGAAVSNGLNHFRRRAKVTPAVQKSVYCSSRSVIDAKAQVKKHFIFKCDIDCNQSYGQLDLRVRLCTGRCKKTDLNCATEYKNSKAIKCQKTTQGGKDKRTTTKSKTTSKAKTTTKK